MFAFERHALWVTFDFRGEDSHWERMGIKNFAERAGLMLTPAYPRYLIRDPNHIRPMMTAYEHAKHTDGHLVAVAFSRAEDSDVFVWAIPDRLPENSEKASTP
jgi:hypothetical protein